MRRRETLAEPVPRRRSVTGAFRWFGALVVSIAFLVGVPMLLLAAPSPLDDDRGVTSLVRAVMDDGQVFDEAIISLVVAIAWVLWAYLVLAAIVETIAVVRGGVVAVRGLGIGQSIARPIISALLWSSTARTS